MELEYGGAGQHLIEPSSPAYATSRPCRSVLLHKIMGVVSPASLRTLSGCMASVHVAIAMFTLCVIFTSCQVHNASTGLDPYEQPLMLSTRTGSNGTQEKIAGDKATIVTAGVS